MDKIVYLLEDRKIGDYSVEHFVVSPYNFDLVMNEGLTPNETYIRLVYKGQCLMSNTPYEWETNREFIENAKGDVLIGGLGLGMIVMEIQDKPEVKSITIVEKSKEVIDMVASQLPLNSKVNIVCDDIFEYQTKSMFDTIYFDIWYDCDFYVCEVDMPKLIHKFQNNLNAGGYINCWQLNEYLKINDKECEESGSCEQKEIFGHTKRIGDDA